VQRARRVAPASGGADARAPGDLETLAAQQLRMLSVVAPVLLPGGLLVVRRLHVRAP
jgi:hypothetical protein